MYVRSFVGVISLSTRGGKKLLSLPPPPPPPFMGGSGRNGRGGGGRGLWGPRQDIYLDRLNPKIWGKKRSENCPGQGSAYHRGVPTIGECLL